MFEDFDFSRFNWWSALIGAVIGVAMAYAAYGNMGKLSWLAVPGMAFVFGMRSDGGSDGTGGDGDSGGGDGGDGD